MPERLKQKSKPVFINEDNYTFVITPGNNSQIVRKCFEKRMDYWKEGPLFSSVFHFKWQPFSKGLRFDQLSLSQKQMVNHFEFHAEITNKDGLFRNIFRYCESNKKNVYDILPITYALDVDSENYQNDYDRFLRSYHIIENAKVPEDTFDAESQAAEVLAINQKLSQHFVTRDKKFTTYCKEKIDNSHFANQNIWILKPTGFNRGRGVSIIESLDKLKSLLRFGSRFR